MIEPRSGSCTIKLFPIYSLHGYNMCNNAICLWIYLSCLLFYYYRFYIVVNLLHKVYNTN